MGQKSSKNVFKNESKGTQTRKKKPQMKYRRDFVPSKCRETFNELPFQWGYGEDSRKKQGEDQSSFYSYVHPLDGPIHAWGVFDGHGGYETSLYTAQYFFKFFEKNHLDGFKEQGSLDEETGKPDFDAWRGSIERVFRLFDEKIGEKGLIGGSTVVIAIYIQKAGCILIANCGDARALISNDNGKEIDQISFDHTPVSDHERINKIAGDMMESNPKFDEIFRLANDNDLGKFGSEIEVSPADKKKMPVVSVLFGETSKLLNTISVSRAFGDFGLNVIGIPEIKIKPFLTNEPTVCMIDLTREDIVIKETDLLCLACDGPFDVLTNAAVITELRKFIWAKPVSEDREETKESEKNEDDGESGQIEAEKESREASQEETGNEEPKEEMNEEDSKENENGDDEDRDGSPDLDALAAFAATALMGNASGGDTKKDDSEKTKGVTFSEPAEEETGDDFNEDADLSSADTMQTMVSMSETPRSTTFVVTRVASGTMMERDGQIYGNTAAMEAAEQERLARYDLDKVLTGEILDQACSDLCTLTYEKSGMDDLSVFVIPLKQLIDL